MNQSKKGVFSVFKQESNKRQAPFYCRWTDEEDKLLFEAIEMYGPHKWSLIARNIPGRTPVQCSTRWLGALNPHVHKGRWSKEEDDVLTASVKPYLEDESMTEDNLPWSRIAQNIPNRTGIQCQARWTEALDPSVRKGRWKKEEDDLLKIGVERFGCCWIRVAGSIPGRTQRQCRTRWNQIQTKRQKSKQKQQSSHQCDISTSIFEEVRKKKRKINDKKTAVQQQSKSTSKHKQDTTEVVSVTPIQLAVPHQTSFRLLGYYNKQSTTDAIVIPSEIQSPLQSPLSLSSSSIDEDDFFCTSPLSSCSSSDDTAFDFSTNTKTMQAEHTTLLTTDTTRKNSHNEFEGLDSTFFDLFIDSTPSISNQGNNAVTPLPSSTTNLLLDSSLDINISSFILLNTPSNQNQMQNTQEQETAASFLDNLLGNPDLFLNFSSSDSSLFSA
ncbi:MAG: Homeodomain-like protein [Benjaminiella poitrasii]|nr:MAG: Homeodomain-like protein [Benjaminiella poitrasii]